MKVVGENEYYKLEIDEIKNRVHWRMIGFWPSMDVVPNFDKDWDKVQSMTKPGWSLFGDLSKLKTMPADVSKAQEERQKTLLTKGCVKVACVVDSSMTKISLNKAIRGSGMESILQYFDSPEKAIQWL